VNAPRLPADLNFKRCVADLNLKRLVVGSDSDWLSMEGWGRSQSTPALYGDWFLYRDWFSDTEKNED